MKKAITEILLQSSLFTDIPDVIDQKGRHLLGRYVGCVEIITDAYRLEEGGWDYVSEYYLAYQLTTGEILAVDGIPNGKDANNVFSLKHKAAIINFGWYPKGFPPEWEGYHVASAAPLALTEEEIDLLPF